jgi:hypothetical protein
MNSDRRQHMRSRLLQRGRVVFRNGYTAIDVVVLDISQGGARIRVSGMIGLPDQFELHLEHGVRRIVELCYRGPEETGLRFVDRAAA